ncbi:heavy-metal-associated domain-containing protein [Noviherbaspirillum malthae]|uniref:heavy-metal-associated domain-containing protein n=1 Tax=Noviherbaspirillum malthae TaxID=1260987 RepID=UPI0018904B9D|nr:heavy-metal-associated domain-containing protein [Noviherbaspirillum malthae]
MYELKVEGMTCGGCASRVTKAIRSVDSNADVNIDLKSKTVRVDTTADVAALASAVTAAGYPATATQSA